MITLLTGDNTFAIRDTLNGQMREARAKHGVDAITIVDANELTPADLPQLLLGVSLFAPERFIVIRDAAANKAVWEKFEEILPNVDQQATVMLVASAADKRTRTYKWLLKNATVRESLVLSESDLVNWLQITARDIGFDIDAQSARYLIDFVGTDQWRLRQDLEKLSLSGQKPSAQLIRDIIEPNPQASVFQMLDAVFAGKPDQVEQHLQILRGSEEPYRFFGLLVNQIYALLLCANGGSRDAQTIARDAGIHPFVVRKLQSVARKLSSKQQQSIVDILADLDRQMKSTGAEPWTLIRVALTSITI